MKNLGKRFLALVVCAITCTAVAFAAVSYSVWSPTYTGRDNLKFHCRTSINSVRGDIYGTGTTVTTDSTKVPKGYAGVTAKLYRNDSALFTEVGFNQGVSTGVTVTTPDTNASGKFYTGGYGHFQSTASGAMLDVDLPISPVFQNGSISAVQYLDMIDDPGVQVNENNETYASSLYADLNDVEVDLVSVWGVNGNRGYIRTSDEPKLPDTPEEAANFDIEGYTIPVYASDGVTVIDSYRYGGGSVEDIK